MRWWIGGLLVANLIVLLLQGLEPVGASEATAPAADRGSLRLLSERRSSDTAPADDLPVAPDPVAVPRVARAPLPEDSPVRPPIPQRTDKCWLFGKFASEDEARGWSRRLPPGLSRIGVEPAKIPEVSGYYVLVPPAPDRIAAKRTLAELRKVGIRDTWLFAAGRFKHAISLGLFSREENARQRVKQLKAKGFESVVEPKVRETEIFRLRLKGRDDAVSRQALRELGQPRNLQEVTCD